MPRNRPRPAGRTTAPVRCKALTAGPPVLDIPVDVAPTTLLEDDGQPGPEQRGYFEAYASVFGVLDSYGDIVEDGAFTRTLDEWRDKSALIPFVWSHDMLTLGSHVGIVDPFLTVEDDTGLLVRGWIDLGIPEGQRLWRLLKGGRIRELSFAYRVRREVADSDANHLLDLDLTEVSATPIGANPATRFVTLGDIAGKTDRALHRAHTTGADTSPLTEALAAVETALRALLAPQSADETPPESSPANEAEDAPSANPGLGESTDDTSSPDATDRGADSSATSDTQPPVDTAPQAKAAPAPTCESVEMLDAHLALLGL